MSKRVVCMVTDTIVHATLCELRGREVKIVGRGRVAFDAPDTLLVDHDADEISAAIGESISQVGASPLPVTLVIPMQWCFVHVLPSSGTRLSPGSLNFELERFLPLPLEEVACGFELLDKGQFLAAALPVEPMRKLLESLAKRGVSVEQITTDVTAAWHGLTDPADSGGVVLLDARWQRFLGCTGDGDVQVGVLGSTQSRWDSDTIVPPLDKSDGGDCATIRDLPSWVILELLAKSGSAARRESAARRVYSAELGGDEALDLINKGACSPAVLDLRVGALAASGEGQRLERLTSRVLATALVLLAMLIGGMQLRMRTLGNHLESLQQSRAEVYRSEFEGQPMPPEAALRVASERVRLEGLTRRAKGLEADLVKTLPPPLDVLRGFVAALPPDTRILLNEARMDESQLILRGQSVEHRDAERIAEAVSAAPGVEARPPRTTRLKNGGIEFSISGVPKNAH